MTMDNSKLRLVLVLTAALAVASAAHAFHSKGVANCASCHTMHNSENGMPVNPSPDNNYLLISNSATDICLSCHLEDNGSVWAYNTMNPAPQLGSGNFIFGEAANINDAPDGNLVPLAGSHGIHNCSAPSRNVHTDPLHVTAPGGTYPAAALGCTSCHDPHGNGNFRMLRGVGNVPAGDYYFDSPAPVAEGLSLTGQSESRTLHTAYQSGWTSWCANCHGNYHEHNPNGFEHPVDEVLTADVRISYALYDGAGNPLGGNSATSYLPEVPFEELTMTTTGTNGPTPLSKITCISCHRAHGSSAVDLGRWDFRVLDIRNDGLVSASYALPTPYSSGSVERQLCVKCHEQDTRTHGFDQACIVCHRTETFSTPGDPTDQFKKP